MPFPSDDILTKLARTVQMLILSRAILCAAGVFLILPHGEVKGQIKESVTHTNTAREYKLIRT